MLVRDPIYHQLRQLLNKILRRDHYSAGDKFLTEREVSGRFGVSRTTANKALSSLVADGTLEFRKGVGTFVKPGVLDYDLRSLVSFTDKARAADRVPKTQVIKFLRLRGADAPDHVVSVLAITPSDWLFYVERLRFADGLPVIFERRFMVRSLCPKINRRDLEGSLYAAWGKYGVAISGANQTIRAIGLSKEDARLLQVKHGYPALLVQAIGYADGSAPLWWEETLYRADAYEFHCQLGGLRSPQPAVGRLLAKT